MKEEKNRIKVNIERNIRTVVVSDTTHLEQIIESVAEVHPIIFFFENVLSVSYSE